MVPRPVVPQKWRPVARVLPGGPPHVRRHRHSPDGAAGGSKASRASRGTGDAHASPRAAPRGVRHLVHRGYPPVRRRWPLKRGRTAERRVGASERWAGVATAPWRVAGRTSGALCCRARRRLAVRADGLRDGRRLRARPELRRLSPALRGQALAAPRRLDARDAADLRGPRNLHVSPVDALQAVQYQRKVLLLLLLLTVVVWGGC
mmetsp:Transcript_34296/g.107665  ORF Transcript_34296/g.107665 Transcript_34296/m.107665 type:complete len:205 (-) Transcript_34296:484-1098(-)